jgi:hypothetical protein
MKYHRQLMNAILNDKINIAAGEVISLKDAPRGYAEFVVEQPKVCNRPWNDSLEFSTSVIILIHLLSSLFA